MNGDGCVQNILHYSGSRIYIYTYIIYTYIIYTYIIYHIYICITYTSIDDLIVWFLYMLYTYIYDKHNIHTHIYIYTHNKRILIPYRWCGWLWLVVSTATVGMLILTEVQPQRPGRFRRLRVWRLCADHGTGFCCISGPFLVIFAQGIQTPDFCGNSIASKR